mmetsp:Transcript_58639/g.143751  ORF Transcript_58639/g.143751 Transcript_58639/m.143751 type:complete len:237 (-) Transcript_58639:113-823(-)
MRVGPLALAHLVDANDPVLARVHLIHVVEGHIDARYRRPAHAVPPKGLPRRDDLGEVVVGKLVQQRAVQRLRPVLVDAIAPVLVEVLLDDARVHALHLQGAIKHPCPDAHRPHELVDVVAAVANVAPKHNHDVLHVESAHHLPRGGLGRREHGAHRRDVCVVPRVVVHEHRHRVVVLVVDAKVLVGHGTQLVAIIPPRHDLGPPREVVSHPPVPLPEVVEDHACPRARPPGEHDRG